MSESEAKADIILIHIDTLMPSNSGLAILDPYLKQHGIKSLLIHSSELDRYADQADVFGFSVLNFNYTTARELTHRLKNKTIIWGGWTPTAVPELILRDNPDVDYVILREGEQRLLNLLRSFKQPELFDKIDGIGYRGKDSRIIVRPPVEFMDLDDLPRPNKLATVADVVFVEIARGCYGGCYYCQDDTAMRFKSAHKAADEIQDWHAEGYSIFHLGNANSASNGQLLHELFRELETRKLPVRISLVGRPADILRNAGVIETLFKSDIIRPCAVELGIEANTQRILDLLGRRTTPEKNAKALSTLIRFREKYAPDVKILAYMILFSHFDITIEDFVENIKFIGEYQCSENAISLYLCGLRNTRIWDDMQARGFVKPGKERFQILNYPFTDNTVERLFRKLIQKPLKKLLLKQKLNSPERNFEFQQKIYAQILEFYNSENIMESVMDFINAPDSDDIIDCGTRFINSSITMPQQL